MTTVGLLAVGRETFDLAQGVARLRDAHDVLAGLDGVHPSGPHEVFTDTDRAIDAIRQLADVKSHVLVVLFATFSDDRIVQAIHRATATPLVLWSLPEERTGGQLALNSMCGAQLGAFEASRLGHRFTSLHVDPRAADAGAAVALAISRVTSAAPVTVDSPVPPPIIQPRPAANPTLHRRAASVCDGLAGATIGRIGGPPAGFTACEADDRALVEATGISVDHIDLEQLFDAADEVDDELLDACRNELLDLGRPRNVPDLEIERSLRLRAALADLAERRAWSAMAVRCWPECLDVYGAAICAPLGSTTASGIPAVCEADVLGAATALLASRVSEHDAFLTDVVDADPSDDTMAIWHCGSASPRWAGTPVEVTGHPIKHRGLAYEFALRPGPVTVARLSRSDRSALSMWTATARLADRPRPFTGTCGVLEWDVPVDGVRARLSSAGVEHHLIVVPGEHDDVFAAVAEQWRIPHHRIAAPQPLALV